MYRTALLSCSFFLLFALFFISCKEDKKKNVEVFNTNDGTPPLNSRTSKARSISVENIFIKLPEEAFQAEGWHNISIKERRDLLSNGNLDNYKATTTENQIIIRENFQNEDDENEIASQIEMMVFRHAKEDYNVVYMGQKHIYENGRTSDKLINSNFWLFDGRHWKEISQEVPSLTTADFFEEDFDLSSVKDDHIIISLNEEYNNTLSASLAYDQYETYGLTTDLMVTKERFFVNLIWNGQMFEKQRKPTVLE